MLTRQAEARVYQPITPAEYELVALCEAYTGLEGVCGLNDIPEGSLLDQVFEHTTIYYCRHANLRPLGFDVDQCDAP